MESFIFSSFMHDSFAKVTTLIKKKKKVYYDNAQ